MGANDDVELPVPSRRSGGCWPKRSRARCRRWASASAHSCWPSPPAAGSSRNPDGPEYGAQLIAKRANAGTDPLFGPLPITPGRDPVARRRGHRPAAGRGAPGQFAGLRRTRRSGSGRLAWGIQFHIETTPAAAAAVGRRGRRRLADYDVERDPGPRRRGRCRRRSRSGGRSPNGSPRSSPTRRRCKAARPIRVSTADPITDPAEIRAALGGRAAGQPAAADRRCPGRRPSRPRTARTDADAGPPRHDSEDDCADRRGAHLLARVGFHDGAAAEELLAGPVLGWWDLDDGPAGRLGRRGGDRRARPQRRSGRRPGRAGAAGRGGARHSAPTGELTDSDPHRPAAGPAAAEPARHLDRAGRPPDRQPARLAGAARDDDERCSRSSARAAADRGERRRRRRRPGHRDGRYARHRSPAAAATAALRAAYLRELTAIAGRDLGGDLDIEVVTEALAHLADQTLQAGAGDRRGRRCRPTPRPAGWRSSRWARPAPANSTTSPTSTSSSSPNRATKRSLATAATLAVADDADLPGGRLGGRRGAAPRGARRPAGAHPGQPRGLLPALGQHLGVPGAAQGPPGGRRPRRSAGRYQRADRPDGLDGRRASRLRRRRAGDAPAHGRQPARPTSPRASSSSARAACATSSSRSSCCSSCTAAATNRCESAATLPALAALHAGGYVGGDDAISLADAYRFLRGGRASAAAAPDAPHPPGPAGRRRAARRSPAAWAFGPTPGAARPTVFEAEWALHAREVRRLHEKLFYRPLLEAVARVPVRGAAADPGRGRPAAGRARASPIRRPRCATSRR